MALKNNNSENYSFLNMAIAYIEVGRVAASANTPMKNTGDYQNAVAYQLFHGIELFYKHMIKKVIGTVDHTHDLKKLEDQYNSLYSGASFILVHPFAFSSYESCHLNPDENQLMEAHLEKFKPQYMVQHLRYPAGKDTGGYSFNLDESYFEQIKKRISEISGIQC
jgi:hypothetical protein